MVMNIDELPWCLPTCHGDTITVCPCLRQVSRLGSIKLCCSCCDFCGKILENYSNHTWFIKSHKQQVVSQISSINSISEDWKNRFLSL